MKAFVLPTFDEQPIVADIPTPEPGPGEVLVRVRAASVNGVDLSIASGQLQGMMEYHFPVVLGKDFAGTVEAVGEGVSDFAAGDRVFGVVFDPSPLHSRSFAEYLAVPAGPNLMRLPDGIDLAAAGVLGLAAVVAIHELAEVVVIANGVRAGRRTAFADHATRVSRGVTAGLPVTTPGCQDDCCTAAVAVSLSHRREVSSLPRRSPTG